MTAIEHTSSIGVSFPGALVLAIAVGFLIYVFTGSSRLVAGVLLLGLLLLLGVGSLRMHHDGRQGGRLVELAPQRQPPTSAEQGPTATTSLLGVDARGHGFVYVIGGSPAMAEGPGSPLMAIAEPLKRSLTALQRNHHFQVFVNFGKETLVPWECDGQSLLPADNHNVVQVMDWIDALVEGTASQRPQRLVPRDELYQALALQPDVIYFVTDGKERQPSAKDLQALERFNTGRTTMHVIQLLPGKDEKPPTWLQNLAQGHRGKFRQVSIAAPSAEKEPTKETPHAERAEAVVAGAPSKRPEWVTSPPQPLDRGPRDSYQAVVTSGFSKGEDRCRENFDTNLLAMAAGYIDQVVERGAGQRVTQAPGARERALQYLSTNVIKQRYREDRIEPEPIGEGVEQFALLEFNPQAAEYFRQEWRQIVQERRLFVFAAGVALLLAFVGTIFGYLKTDTATRGYYSGRLRFGTGVVILILLAVAVKLIFAIMV